MIVDSVLGVEAERRNKSLKFKSVMDQTELVALERHRHPGPGIQRRTIVRKFQVDLAVF